MAIMLVLSAAVLTAAGPIALKFLVDNFGTTDGFVFASGSLAFIAMYVASQWAARSLSELQALAHGRAEQRVHRRLSRGLFGHIMSLPMQFHLERKTGALSQTLNQGLLGFRLILQHAVYSILPVIAQLATMAGVLLHFGHPTFLGILGGSLFAYTAAFAYGVIRISGPAHAVSAAHIDANAVMTESIINYETVKHFDAEHHVRGQYDEALGKSEKQWAEFYTRKAANGLVVATIFGLSLAACVGYAAWEVAAGRMTVGDFVLVNTYLLMIVRPLEMLGVALRDIAQGLAFVSQMLDLMREESEPRVESLSSDVAPIAARLVFDNVSFAYRPGRDVLRNVSFSVPPGRTVAIVGRSGSGKSSLIRLLMRLYEPNSGQILIDEVNVNEMPTSQLRSMTGVVPQDMVLFNDTIANNIAFGRHGCSSSEIERVAKLAHIHAFVSTLPDGYETVVGNRGLKLSGGEKQRVAIARAALKRPRIYIFDEATSSLDVPTERAILRNLIEVSRGTTTLIIAHRLATVIHADEIVVLDGGCIIERGSHRKLLGMKGTYAAMWRSQRLNSEAGTGHAA